jgi:hypothetical protein
MKSDFLGQLQPWLAKYEAGSLKIEFMGWKPLTIMDMRVLQGLSALSGIGGGEIDTKSPETPAGHALAESLFKPLEKIERDSDPDFRNAATVKCTFKALAETIALKNGGYKKIIEASFNRLFGMSVFIGDNGKTTRARLISVNNDKVGFHAALNPQLSSAILGGQFVYIDMQEVRMLKTDTSRLLHQQLCARIDTGRSLRFTMNSLVEYCFGLPSVSGLSGHNTVSDQRKDRDQKKAIMNALEELANLGWFVDEYAADSFLVERPVQSIPSSKETKSPKVAKPKIGAK